MNIKIFSVNAISLCNAHIYICFCGEFLYVTSASCHPKKAKKCENKITIQCDCDVNTHMTYYIHIFTPKMTTTST